jgi:hypothetical protein
MILYQANGDEGVYFNSEGSSYFRGGRVGIGTRDPEQWLDVRGNAIISGGVGIGTTAPASALHLASASSSTYLTLEKPSSTTESGFEFKTAGASKWGIYTGAHSAGNPAAEDLQFVASGLAGEDDARPRIRLPDENNNVLLALSGGNVGIGTDSPQAKLDVNGKINCTVLELTSDRNQKEDFATVDVRRVLDRLAGLPILTWAYTNDAKARHIGPVAQDWKAVFPDLGSDDKHIAAGDLASVALAAIQGLHAELQETKARLAAKDARIVALEQKLSQMDTLTARLAAVEKLTARAVSTAVPEAPTAAAPGSFVKE